MQIQERELSQAKNTTLVHNIAYASGRTAIRKGTQLTAKHLDTLRELGYKRVLVAILDANDVNENDAALALADVLDIDCLQPGRVSGGRITFRAAALGLLTVNVDQLRSLNLVPGITLATKPQHSVINAGDDVATLKIIPLAVPHTDLNQALNVVQVNKPILTFRPLPPRRQVALLLVGASTVHAKLRADFEMPIQNRLTKLTAELTSIKTVPHSVDAISNAVDKLATNHDLVIIAGQTSIMALDDLVPQAVIKAGAEITVYGAPVEPGNLLMLAYLKNTPILGAPGCVRYPETNIADLVLPRLLLGDQLTQRDIAEYALGGLLKSHG